MIKDNDIGAQVVLGNFAGNLMSLAKKKVAAKKEVDTQMKNVRAS